MELEWDNSSTLMLVHMKPGKKKKKSSCDIPLWILNKLMITYAVYSYDCNTCISGGKYKILTRFEKNTHARIIP